MRVKLQLVLCSDEGHEETVTDIVSLKKDCHRVEHLGLTLAESKQLLKLIQKKLLQEQIDGYLGSVSKVEVAIFTPPVQRHIDSQTTRSRCRASASILRSRWSSAPGV
jgi:hypothetical protein